MTLDNLQIIASITSNWCIGKDNNLLYRIPDDLQFFKDQTVNTTLVMGYYTWLSLPRELPGRRSIILSRSLHQQDIKCARCDVFNSIAQLIEYVTIHPEHTFSIIGGGEVFNQLLKYTPTLYLTMINVISNGDTFFPEVNLMLYDKVDITSVKEYNQINYQIIKLTRK